MCHNKNELKSAVAKYRRLQAQKAEIERELEAVKADINDYLEFKGIEPGQKVIGSNYCVFYSIFERGTFNVKRLEEALGDTVNTFKDYTAQRRLTVK